MEEKLGIITKEDLEVLSKKAFESAKSKGFYPDTGIDTTLYLMFIIVEMSEALQADRKNRHGSIEDYEIEIEMGRYFPTAYRNSLEGTVESEFADIAIRILSLLGSIMDSAKIELMGDNDIKDEYKLAKFIFGSNIVEDLYRLIEKMGVCDLDDSPNWYLAKHLQEMLIVIFAIAHSNNINLMEHIRLKMKYNETRPYLHGSKY
jgi:NTP pyrophosphatase (non-canonical NTP hydrolase)